jgi:hypothetical protein
MSNRDANELAEEDDALFINTSQPATTDSVGSGDSPAIPSLMLVGRPGLPSTFGVSHYANLSEKQIGGRSSAMTNSDNVSSSNTNNNSNNVSNLDSIMEGNNEMPQLLSPDAIENVEVNTTSNNSNSPLSLPIVEENHTSGKEDEQMETNEKSIATQPVTPPRQKSPEELADEEEVGYYDSDRSLVDEAFQGKLQKAAKTISKRLQVRGIALILF